MPPRADLRYPALAAAVFIALLAAFSVFVWGRSTRPLKDRLCHRFLPCTAYFTDSYNYYPAGSAPRGRVVMIPGKGQSANEFVATRGARVWLQGLKKLNIDALVLSDSAPPACWLNHDGGRNYRNVFLTALDNIEQDAARRHGRVGHTVIAGVSLGGLHAMIAYAASPGRYAGWEADVSVTKLSALWELKNLGDVPQFDPFQEIPRLRNSAGYLT